LEGLEKLTLLNLFVIDPFQLCKYKVQIKSSVLVQLRVNYSLLWLFKNVIPVLLDILNFKRASLHVNPPNFNMLTTSSHERKKQTQNKKLCGEKLIH
jgi:hypothetical protein